MEEWAKSIQQLIGEIDRCIKGGEDEALALRQLADTLGYSEFYVSRRFKEIAGMPLREYLRCRRLALALKELRDTNDGILEIALRYGFSSHEAFTRSFKQLYGITPSEYRSAPVPVVLRTVLKPFDCYLVERGSAGAAGSGADADGADAGATDTGGADPSGAVQAYFVTIPAHKFLHIRNCESVGYWDFWQKQSEIPGQDCATICGLLDSIPGKLDDLGGEEANSGSGQLMAFINEPDGRICSWGIPLAEAYGVRLPADHSGAVPPQMQLMDVPEGTYLVFEHGPFDFGTENAAVEARIEQAMRTFDYVQSGYEPDTTQGRVFYFYHDPDRFWKYVRPVRKVDPEAIR